MKRIGFWFENGRISTIDLSEPELGNSGVGGTEYQFVLLAYFLQKFQNMEVTLFVEMAQPLPSGVKQIVVSGLLDAYKQCSLNDIDFLIFRPRRDITKEMEEIKTCQTKLIPWLHITPKREYLDWFANNPLIHRVIFVGDDQRMRSIDHEIYKNSSTIYNASSGLYQLTNTRRGNTVVYVGALVPRKGFHILAKAWRDVRRESPQAQLLVIGSGALYDTSTQLGPLKLAEATYEAKFTELLGGKDEFEKNGVRFLGNLGTEKKVFIDSAVVGVVNPSGLTENCPMSVVEFYQSGVPVVSSFKYGMRDMIVSGQTGILCRSEKEIGKSLVKFLNETLDSDQFGQNAIDFAKKKFAPDLIVEDWIKIFDGNFAATRQIKGYWIHKIFSALKSFSLLPSKFPIVEDQKIYLAGLRNRFRISLR